jgi:cation:H+ antiporter
MTAGPAVAGFILGAVVSLATSWVLVVRLERVGERLGLTEALLGMVAALAADAPEITASVTALVHHQRTVSSGVVIGSNVFNLAALLGLGSVVAGRIVLHRKVVLLGGAVGLAVSLVCLLAVAGLLTAAAALAVVLVVLIPYLVILSVDHALLPQLRLG